LVESCEPANCAHTNIVGRGRAIALRLEQQIQFGSLRDGDLFGRMTLMRNSNGEVDDGSKHMYNTNTHTRTHARMHIRLLLNRFTKIEN
jgi:hypothetical protein